MRSFTVSIAGFFIKLSFLASKKIDVFGTESFTEALKQQFDGFIVRKPARSDFIIEFAPRQFENLFLTAKNRKMYIELLEYKKKNVIRTSYTISKTQLVIIMREVLQMLLSRNNGVVLHASAVEVNGKAYIFFGDSGAGKSTSMLMLKDKFRPLSDDSIVLRKTNGVYMAYQTPFQEKNEVVKKKIEGVPFGKAFFLVKSDSFGVKNIKRKQLLINKMARQLFITKDSMPFQMKHLMAFVGSSDEFYNLRFAKDPLAMQKFIAGLPL